MKPNQAKRQLRQIRERNKNNLSCNWLKTLIIVQIFRFTLRIRIFPVLPPTLELGKSLVWKWEGKQRLSLVAVWDQHRQASLKIPKCNIPENLKLHLLMVITSSPGSRHKRLFSRPDLGTSFAPRAAPRSSNDGLLLSFILENGLNLLRRFFLSLDFSTTEKPSSGASVFPRKLPKGKTTTARHSYLVSCWWWCHHPHPLQVPTGQYRRRGCKESRKQFPSQKPKRQHRAKLNIQLVVNCEKLYWY